MRAAAAVVVDTVAVAVAAAVAVVADTAVARATVRAVHAALVATTANQGLSGRNARPRD